MYSNRGCAILYAVLTTGLVLGLAACGSEAEESTEQSTAFDVEFTDTVEVSNHSEFEQALEQAEEVEEETEGEENGAFRILVTADIDFAEDADGFSYGGDVALYLGSPDGDRYTIDAGDSEQRILSTTSTREDIYIERLRFTGGSHSNGAAIRTDDYSNLYINDAQFDDNHAGFNGGAVDTGSTTGGTFYEGAVATTVRITNSEFRDNTAIRGGALKVNTGSLEIADSEFINNTAEERGGAVASHLEADIEDSRFEGNSIDAFDGGTVIDAAGNAGDMELDDSTLEIWSRNSSYIENTNEGAGSDVALSGAAIFGKDEGNEFDPAEQEPGWDD